MHGGTYYLAVEQVLSSLKLQRLKLFHRLSVDGANHCAKVESVCCSDPFKDEELETLDSAIIHADSHSDEENATLYYISGYVAFKLGANKANEPTEQPASEFTDLVSRGKLSHPVPEMFYFSKIAYKVFLDLQGLPAKLTCAKRLKNLLQLLLSSLPIDLEMDQGVCQILSNVFFQGLVAKASSNLINNPVTSALCERKLNKLSCS